MAGGTKRKGGLSPENIFYNWSLVAWVMGQDWENLVRRSRCWHLYQSALAAITKYHRLGDLNN